MDRQGRIKIFSCISLDGYVLESGDYGFREFCGSVAHAVMDGMYYASLLAQDLRLPEMEYHIIAPCETENVANDKTCVILLRPEEGFGYTEAVGSLRDNSAGDIWAAGGHELISSLLEEGMIDEMTLNIFPVTAGSGRPMFSRRTAGQHWSPVHCTRYDNGIVQARYTANRLTTTP